MPRKWLLMLNNMRERKNFWKERGYAVEPKTLEDVDLDYEGECQAKKEGAWVMSMRHDEASRVFQNAIKGIEQARELDKAEAQLLGWKHAKNGGDLFSLVRAMGLTFKEWKTLLSEYNPTFLSPDDKKEVDKFFGI